MKYNEIERAAMKRQSVVAKVRNSTEMMEIVGKIEELTTVYGKGEKEFPVVVIVEERSNSIIRVAPEDVLRVIGEDKPREKAANEIEYVNLGRVGNGEAFRILAMRNGLKVASYNGYMHEVEDKMVCYVKEIFGGAEGIEGKIEIPFSEFRKTGGRRDAV
jgi:hypothetical protein